MADYKISGNLVKTFVELTLEEMELEATYLLGRSELEVKKLMLQEGLTKKVATAQVLNVIQNKEAFMGVWINRNKRLIDEIHSQLVAQPIRNYGKKNKKKLFVWVLDARAKHCGDCIDMSGMEAMTLDDWLSQGVGLPREGGTQCNVGCKCSLQLA